MYVLPIYILASVSPRSSVSVLEYVRVDLRLPHQVIPAWRATSSEIIFASAPESTKAGTSGFTGLFILTAM
jgi:hypothetical protein